MNIKQVFNALPNWLIIGSIVTGIVASFDGVIISFVVASVTKFNQSSSMTSIVSFVAVGLLASLFVYFMMAMKYILQNKAVYILNVAIKQNFVYEQVNSSDLDKGGSENASRMFNDYKLVETNYFALIFELAGAILTSVVSGAYVLILNFRIGLMFIVFSLLPLIVPRLFGKSIERHSEIWQRTASGFMGSITDLLKGLPTIKSYLAEKFIFDDATDSLHNTEHAYEKMNDVQAWGTFASAALSMISFFVPLLAGLVFIQAGYIRPAVIIGIFLANDRVVGPLRSAVEYVNQMKTTEQIRDGIKMHKFIFRNSEDIQPLDAPEIVLNEVSFSYPDGKKIFGDVSLDIKFRDKILISGPSGAGKSTLLNLIQGELKPTTGSLEIIDGGKKMSNYEKSAYIQQEPFLFNKSLRFNLVLAQNVSDDRCEQVLRKVGLLNELGKDSLNKCYGEGGSDLSGGQRQRVEIARALLANKRILIIDEGTSSLDKDNTSKVRTIIEQLPTTVVEVAHVFDEHDMKVAKFVHYELQDYKLTKVE